MDGETLTDAITEDAAMFTATMFYRDWADIETDVLQHDGSVVLTSGYKMNGTHDVWRAMYEAHTNSDTLILFVVPNMAAARGTVLQIQDEMERCPFPDSVWGIERSTEYEVEFSNGSLIKAFHVQDSTAGAKLRGYNPDLLVVDNWVEEGVEISDKIEEEVLVPMTITDDTDVWINDTTLSDDQITNAVLQQGAYVKQMER